MLNLVNQNKQYARKDTVVFSSNDYVKELRFCCISKGYIMSYKPFWIHQYLYFLKTYKIIVGTSRIFRQRLGNSYFVKIKTSRLQMSKLSGNR